MLSVPGLQALRLNLLTSAVKSYEGLLEGRDDPELRTALAETHFRAGKVYGEIGEADEAKRANAAALALYRELSKADPDNVALQVGLVKAGEYGAGPQALAFWEQLVRKDPKNRDYQREVAILIHSRASALHRAGEEPRGGAAGLSASPGPLHRSAS